MNIKDFPKKATAFLKEVRFEMKKVNWPSRKDTVRDTLVVIAVSVIVAAFLGGVEFLFTALLNRFVM